MPHPASPLRWGNGSRGLMIRCWAIWWRGLHTAAPCTVRCRHRRITAHAGKLPSASRGTVGGNSTGIVIAIAASWGLSSLMGVPYAFDPFINLLSLAFSAGIGVLFG